MTPTESETLRAAFVALTGRRRGWLREEDADIALRALEVWLEAKDPEWLAQWRDVENKAGNAPLTSEHGRTLERFGGNMTRLYLLARQIIDSVAPSETRVMDDEEALGKTQPLNVSRAALDAALKRRED